MKRNLINRSIFNWVLTIGLMLFFTTAAIAANDTVATENEIGIAYRSQVRIVTIDAKWLDVVMSEGAISEDIILEGTFESVTIDASEVKISTQGDTTIREILVAKKSDRFANYPR